MTDGESSDQEQQQVGKVAAVGYGARGTLYVLLGVLVARVAFGGGSSEADQQGAFSLLSRQPFGAVLLGILAAGLFAYSAFRFWRMVRGSQAGGSDDLVDRVVEAVRGVVYLGIGGLATATLLGSGSGGSSDTRSITRELVRTTWGRVLVGVVGAVFVGVGLRQLAMTRSSADELEQTEMSDRRRRLLRALGVAGLAGRALAFGLIGGFLVYSAFTRDGEGGGLDVALSQVRDASFGPAVVGLVAVGFLAFAAWCFAHVRHHRLHETG